MFNWLAASRATVSSKLNRRAVVNDKHGGWRYPHLCRKSSVGNLHAHLAVHRHEVLRFGEREHHFQLLLRGVT